MNQLWLYSVRAYIRIGMFFYFRRIKLYNVENIPKNKPVLILANHQNALLDALLIATQSGRYSYFLTRAAVFNKPLISKLLKSLRMLPVYRIRDGWNTISNNTAIFEKCIALLQNKQAVVIFPEGNHNLERRVRPFSKGFTRIVLGALETYPEMDLQLIPVGLNYQQAINYPDTVALYFGKPISAQTFVSQNSNEAVINLKKRMFSEITKLTTNIPQKSYSDTLETLDVLEVDYLNPELVNNCIANNFVNCHQKPKSKIIGLKRFLKGLMILNVLLPYLIWKFSIQPKIKELEFMSTFRFAVALTLVPLYLLILVFVLIILCSLKLALIYLLSVLLLTVLAVKL